MAAKILWMVAKILWMVASQKKRLNFPLSGINTAETANITSYKLHLAHFQMSKNEEESIYIYYIIYIIYNIYNINFEYLKIKF